MHPIEPFLIEARELHEQLKGELQLKSRLHGRGYLTGRAVDYLEYLSNNPLDEIVQCVPIILAAEAATQENRKGSAFWSGKESDIWQDVLLQVTKGKGQRHGGDTVPFLEQPWVHLAETFGVGFLLGQAAKKLQEAESVKEGQDYINEVIGAIVYTCMALHFTRSEENATERGNIRESDFEEYIDRDEIWKTEESSDRDRDVKS